jgi:2-dehydropantoate 2-reductase
MKIAVMGAGGIGAYTGGRLVASGTDVGFVARGAQLDALRQKGLTIISPRGDALIERVAASDDPQKIGVSDVVIFTVKLWDTESAAEAMKPMVGPDTLVLTFQNGVDSVELISRHVPRDQVVAGTYVISAHLASPGVVEDTGAANKMVVDGINGDPRIAAFKALCDASVGLECEIADPETDHVWEKFIVLTAFSGSTALLRKPIGEVVGHPVTRQFMRELLQETTAVALAKGVRLSPNIAERLFEGLSNWSPSAFASMAVDLMLRRRLELDWLSGRVHHLGQELGIPTPAHTAVYRGLVLHQHGAG